MKEILWREAQKAMQHAYAPYSKFHVGACVLCFDGTLFYGANVENASYGLTCCAERNALFSAYSYGYRKEDIAALAVVCDGKQIASPCGACRQVMVELLSPHTPIFMGNAHELITSDVETLLPMSFTREDLHHV